MNHDEATGAVAASLRRIAPEVDPDEVDHDRPMAEELELDSMDFLSLLAELHERTGVQVPESDYPQVQTLSALVAYLVRAG
jgi:acyl carrier protein